MEEVFIRAAVSTEMRFSFSVTNRDPSNSGRRPQDGEGDLNGPISFGNRKISRWRMAVNEALESRIEDLSIAWRPIDREDRRV